MTAAPPDPRLALAETLARIEASGLWAVGQNPRLLESAARRLTPRWTRHLDEVLDAARAVLAAELLRQAPVYGLGPERQEPFVMNGDGSGAGPSDDDGYYVLTDIGRAIGRCICDGKPE